MKPFRNLSGREKQIELLRWFCVLPAVAVAWYVGNRGGALLARFAMTIGIIPDDHSFGSTCARYLLWLLPDGMACIVAGAWTAPRCRFFVACLVAVAWALLTDMIHRWTADTIIPTTVAAICGVAFISHSEKPRIVVPEVSTDENSPAV